MEQAGKQGVPIILADVPPAPGSKYQTSTWTQNQVEADAGHARDHQEGRHPDRPRRRGQPERQGALQPEGRRPQELPRHQRRVGALRQLGQRTLRSTSCRSTSASHPQPLAGVLQDGGMFAGVVQAFESRGIKVPPVAIEQCEAGDLSWWLSKHRRLLDGRRLHQRLPGRLHVLQRGAADPGQQGPEVQRAVDAGGHPRQHQPEGVRQAGPAAHVRPDELPGPKTAWCDNKCLDKYFNDPGPATK